MRIARRATGLIVLLVWVIPSAGRADEAMTMDRLLELERERYAAMVAADTSALAPLLDDGLVFTHASGRIDTKASLLGRLRSGELDYLAIATEGENPRIYGDAGIVTGVSIIDVRAAGGERRLRLRFTSVWVNSPEGWRVVAYQSTGER